MRNPRFLELFRKTVSAWPEVTEVESVDQGGQGVAQRITFSDGVQIDLRIVNSAPPSGDDYTKPETIVTKNEKQVG
ncbi:hypothetical protein LX15_002582 [Streptoalloteichus tenebrarius]|uniref:Uncharacterized protein n=1 Tax=Streptoalloteichus tenebrarius (strain ATCC 17920 / DSM 40477 / JCM 4838 / CBS 697.72 / NBRC 16177 / NCIMB 11028 / NRRL B-12390 / A12253. 1 / ISP 5477) TaxID=1933 RepID=A0ABT1HTM8_STRSD|nr:hypothetical protein [Streptoalloteichus tenebrarius]MCP2258884.1 hypothetical protein [Streptoalloteichus tenebrarius]BFE99431.1 hypothetical protein GCM10020241_11070 [Streptoalloteichus tenebrarius]